jgi:SAM-dependent methyltransferase
MSFWPFPKSILGELRAGLDLGPGLELGAGGGQLRSRLESVGISLLALDRTAPADVLGDVRHLPLRNATAGVLVLANLLRHLDPPGRRACMTECSRALVPGGRLLLLEDDPVARCAAEANYREALGLLAAADPGRGTVLDLDEVLARRPAGLDEPGLDLHLENHEVVEDPLAPLRWIEATGRVGQHALVSLQGRIDREGMRYGAFRACVIRRTGDGVPS